MRGAVCFTAWWRCRHRQAAPRR
ncbi:hypothetical protein R2601_04108 [Salipiger bermudensis HTCC2601]|uniref:Uncharacterized protein n=1 Tax=Salipiger bermudensis (strain DSM 26914 / JCM 13377 / KCTC 12554 / HTCC2601) TaxID=314265 RepID=Q0FW24_SALBH|nr:hypothetical protein R2601_04108 [Salipiger bermudensis HTCC2601]